MSSILGPSGLPVVELGGERAWLQRVIGDIVCSFQWLDLRQHGEATEGPEPCMVLFPTVRRLETGAYTIPARNAWAYADSQGNPTRQLVGTAWKAAVTLGFDVNDRAAVKRVIDVIVEGLPDLIRMPSDQPGALDVKRFLHGIEGRARVNGRTIHEEVL